MELRGLVSEISRNLLKKTGIFLEPIQIVADTTLEIFRSKSVNVTVYLTDNS